VPDRIAAALGEETLTFAEVEHRAHAMAAVLGRLGVGRGSRVGVWSGTDLRLVPVFAALAKTGAVFIPLNAGLGPAEAVAVAAVASPDVLLVDEDRAQGAPPVAARVVALAELVADAGRATPGPAGVGLSEGDPHVVFFTSGSTGRPKGAVLSHRVNYLRSHPGALLEPRGAMVCPYPLFHMGAWTIALQQWQARDRVVFVPSADPDAICAAVHRHRATRLNCIPAVWRRILDGLATRAGHDLSSIRFADTGTSATPPELLDAIASALPDAGIRVFYGSTEAGGVTTLESADVRRKPGSCGVPGPASEVRIDAGGELWVRGPLVFDGYLDDPNATAQALVDGWYRTGDLAEADADGYLTIVGRVGEVIRTGGESVAPAEVEAVVRDHPDVADVAVIGVPDPQWGEVVCAVVVPASSAGLTLAGVRAFCGTRLASFKHPRRLEVVDVIPRTAATSQVQRRLLVERFR
jgi:acyl-CoA synthetase (AMP-forming)/AMP-acid ligase II